MRNVSEPQNSQISQGRLTIHIVLITKFLNHLYFTCVSFKDVVIF